MLSLIYVSESIEKATTKSTNSNIINLSLILEYMHFVNEVMMPLSARVKTYKRHFIHAYFYFKYLGRYDH